MLHKMIRPVNKKNFRFKLKFEKDRKYRVPLIREDLRCSAIVYRYSIPREASIRASVCLAASRMSSARDFTK